MERDIRFLIDYVNENHSEPVQTKDPYEFEWKVYSKWAAHEILDRMIFEASKLPEHITGKEKQSAIDIIEEFLVDVNYYAETADDSRNQFIFLVARFEAKRILNLFLERKYG